MKKLPLAYAISLAKIELELRAEKKLSDRLAKALEHFYSEEVEYCEINHMKSALNNTATVNAVKALAAHKKSRGKS